MSLRTAAFVLLSGTTAVGCNPPKHLTIETVGESMRFDQDTLVARAGQRVHLTLNNNADGPTMTHNWVLVRPGTEASVAAAGALAGREAGYVPSSPDVLAHTVPSQPHHSVDVTFTAPPVGRYPYICTNPGHWATMRGTLITTP